jgi:hypothetical protein
MHLTARACPPYKSRQCGGPKRVDGGPVHPTADTRLVYKSYFNSASQVRCGYGWKFQYW